MSKVLSATFPFTNRTVITASLATHLEEVPETPKAFTLLDSVGVPSNAMTSCSDMPSRMLAKFSWVTLEQAARTSTMPAAAARAFMADTIIDA